MYSEAAWTFYLNDKRNLNDKSVQIYTDLFLFNIIDTGKKSIIKQLNIIKYPC